MTNARTPLNIPAPRQSHADRARRKGEVGVRGQSSVALLLTNHNPNPSATRPSTPSTTMSMA